LLILLFPLTSYTAPYLLSMLVSDISSKKNSKETRSHLGIFPISYYYIIMISIVANTPKDHFCSTLKKVPANAAAGICNWTKALTQH
jgi:hypothetical protein